MAAAEPHVLDYRESEQVACARFGVESVMGQDGLAEISEKASPGEWARYYIQHASTHHPVFIASAIDAMLEQLIHTQDHSELDDVKRALALAQHERWACACIENHTTDFGDFPGEKPVVDLLHQVVDLELVRRNRESITKDEDQAH